MGASSRVDAPPARLSHQKARVLASSCVVLTLAVLLPGSGGVFYGSVVNGSPIIKISGGLASSQPHPAVPAGDRPRKVRINSLFVLSRRQSENE